MKKCPHCNNTYLDDQMYCPKDNYRLVKDETIPNKINRSEPLSDRYKICPQCKQHYNLTYETCPKCNLFLETRRNGQLTSSSTRTTPLPTPKYNAPKCPTCGSTDVNKISGTKKAVGFLTVGVFSSNFGKTMECKNCGYKW